MRHQPNPAAIASAQMSGLMAVVGVGAMRAADAAREVMLERRQASVFQGYADALSEAQAYAYEVAGIAEAAVARVTELEAENARLKAACRQRQAVIDGMRGAA